MIKGIVAAVPGNVVKNHDEAFVKATGVRERRVATGGQDVTTLAEDATVRLLMGLGWDVSDVEALVFVTQTPIVRMPAMSCILSGRMGMSCPAFDVNLACSGYVYGLWLASQLQRKMILVAGDTVSKMTEKSDLGTQMLFGDAVTATALDPSDYAFLDWPTNAFLGTDGSGWDKLIADPSIRMDGPEVMSFAIASVPPLVERVTMNGHVDWHFFHQANAMIVRHVAKKARIPEELAPMNIGKYGNTSSASIPLLMADSTATEALMERRNRVAMYGFGAGWSWGGLLCDLEPLKVCEVIES